MESVVKPKGEGHTADRRSDVYSMGAVLFRLLTGKPPFEGDIEQVFRSVAEQEPPKLRKIVPEMPKDLETIVHTCLQKDPRHRYANAAELRDDLLRFTSGLPVNARSISPIERVWRMARRNRRKALVTLVAVVVSTLLVGFSAWQRNYSLQLEADRSATLKQIELEEYSKRIDACHQLYQEGNIAKIRSVVAELAESEAFRDLRGFEWGYWWRRSQRVIDYFEHGASVLSVAFSADEKTLACGGVDGAISFWDLEDRSLLRRLSIGSKGVKQLCLLPSELGVLTLDTSGELLLTNNGSSEVLNRAMSSVTEFCVVQRTSRVYAMLGSGAIHCWDFEGVIVDSPLALDSRVKSLDISASGLLAALSVADEEAGKGWVEVRRLPSWDLVGRLAEQSIPHRSVRFAANDLQVVVMSDGPHTTSLWELSTGSRLVEYREWEPTKAIVQVSPDGDAFGIVGKANNRITLFDVHSGEPVNTLVGHGNSADCVAFSSSGGMIATGGSDGTVALWDISADLSDTFTNVGHGRIAALAYSPDSRLLASAHSDDRSIRIFASDSRELLFVLKTGLADVKCLSFDATSSTVAIVDVNDQIEIWQLLGKEPKKIATTKAKRNILAAGFAANDDSLFLISNRTIESYHFSRDYFEELEKIKPASNLPTIAAVKSSMAAIVQQERVEIWDIGTDTVYQRNVYAIPGNAGRPCSAEFSSDQSLLAIGCYSGIVVIVDLDTGESNALLATHTGSVTSLAFGQDASTLYSGGDDGVLRIWDIRTRRQCHAFNEYNPITAIAVSNADQRVASADGEDGRIVQRESWSPDLITNPIKLLRHRLEDAVALGKWSEARLLSTRIGNSERYALAQALAGEGNWGKASKVTRKLSNTAPTNVRYQYLHGHVLCALGHWNEAAKLFQRCLELGEENQYLCQSPWWTSRKTDRIHKNISEFLNHPENMTSWQLQRPTSDYVLRLPTAHRGPNLASLAHRRSVPTEPNALLPDASIPIYAACFLYSNSNKEVSLSLACRGSVELYVNGERIYTWQGYLGSRHLVNVSIREGWNPVVTQIIEARGWPAIYVRPLPFFEWSASLR